MLFCCEGLLVEDPIPTHEMGRRKALNFFLQPPLWA